MTTATTKKLLDAASLLERSARTCRTVGAHIDGRLKSTTLSLSSSDLHEVIQSVEEALVLLRAATKTVDSELERRPSARGVKLG